MEIALKRILQDQLIKYCQQNTGNQICSLASLLINIFAPVLIIGIALSGVFFVWVTIKSKDRLRSKAGGLLLGMFLLFFSVYLYTLDNLILGKYSLTLGTNYYINYLQ